MNHIILIDKTMIRTKQDFLETIFTRSLHSSVVNHTCNRFKGWGNLLFTLGFFLMKKKFRCDIMQNFFIRNNKLYTSPLSLTLVFYENEISIEIPVQCQFANIFNRSPKSKCFYTRRVHRSYNDVYSGPTKDSWIFGQVFMLPVRYEKNTNYGIT